MLPARRALIGVLSCAALSAAGACKSAPATPVTAPPAVPQVTWQQKITWMVRLEDQRLLRDPNPPPRPILRAATATQPPLVGPAQPSDLVELLADRNATVRVRAALAIGRVGLAEGVEPLSRLLVDDEPDVRQMAAFALGLIGDASGRAALLRALGDASPIVQGRAAEALALIGDRGDASAVAAMVQRYIRAGALASVDPDDLTYPLAPEVEATRLGVYALVRLGSFDALSAAVLDAAGQPVSRWWPIAYALQRLPDARAVSALLTLLDTPGRYTAAFAAKGLSPKPPAQAVAALRQIVEQRKAHPAVLVQALRSIAASGNAAAAPAVLRLAVDSATEPSVRVEAMTALVPLAGKAHIDYLVDLLSDESPEIRAAATRALARVDADSFIAALAGLDADPHWTVRVAQAQALGTLPPERAALRLRAMLLDADRRVVPAVIAAVAGAKLPDAEGLIVERLKAEDFAVRAAAATALADLKATSSIGALTDAYRAAPAETTYVARAAALSAISRLDRQAARPLLDEALKDRDWAVRLRAEALLREQGVSPIPPALRPATAGRPLDDQEWPQIVLPKYTPRATIETTRGPIEIDLAITDAPLTVHNFITLARRGFFNGLTFHRVVSDFVIQGGDPRGDGEGGPGYSIRDEINQRPYLRGTVGMALDWEDTGGSQFFITHSPQPHLDARYTVFGQVISGMDVVDRIRPSDVITRVRVRDGVADQ
jgi:cyclophilin family peptidyl-prolyl cis-trans isomerase/HEAT repeat protein